MWEIFQNTGHIEAYLIYRTCNCDHNPQHKTQPERQTPISNQN